METTAQESGEEQGREHGLDSAEAAFVWADLETLEELVVEVSGSLSFLRHLEELGFERLPRQGRGLAGVSPRAAASARRVLMDVRGERHSRRSSCEP
jgi:hypothetical protein